MKGHEELRMVNQRPQSLKRQLLNTRVCQIVITTLTRSDEKIATLLVSMSMTC
jgi:hypothetical protein